MAMPKEALGKIPSTRDLEVIDEWIRDHGVVFEGGHLVGVVNKSVGLGYDQYAGHAVTATVYSLDDKTTIAVRLGVYHPSLTRDQKILHYEDRDTELIMELGANHPALRNGAPLAKSLATTLIKRCAVWTIGSCFNLDEEAADNDILEYESWTMGLGIRLDGGHTLSLDYDIWVGSGNTPR